MTAMLDRPFLTDRQEQLLTACQEAAGKLYDAESALHAARDADVDSWTAAAYDKLHAAIEAHLAAVSALARARSVAAAT